jgi:phosphate-selective porin OprO/OprP
MPHRSCNHAPGRLVGVLLALQLPVAAAQLPQVGGSLRHDFGHYEVDGASDQQQIARRQRLSLSGAAGERVRYKLEYDFSSGVWTDVYVDVAIGRGILRTGHFKQPYSMDELTSSGDLPLMEGALPRTAFSLSRRLGLQYRLQGDAWTTAFSHFGQTITGEQSGRGWSVRGTWAPLRQATATRVLHLGLSLSAEDPDSGLLRLRTHPETRLVPRQFVDTGSVAGIERIDRAALEFGWLQEALLLQAEQFELAGERDGLSTLHGEGSYLQASWMLGAARRSYDNGLFHAPELKKGQHAWELVGRFSRIDLDSAASPGGQQDNLVLGANLMLGPNWRLLFHHIWIDADRQQVDGDARALAFRVQLHF